MKHTRHIEPFEHFKAWSLSDVELLKSSKPDYVPADRLTREEHWIRWVC